MHRKSKLVKPDVVVIFKNNFWKKGTLFLSLCMRRRTIPPASPSTPARSPSHLTEVCEQSRLKPTGLRTNTV